jgi:predicted nucleic acid-binding protein
VSPVVVDASVVVAALVDAGPVGRWAETWIAADALAAPHLLPAEVTNVVRRACAAGELSTQDAALALTDLADLDVSLFGFGPVAERVWELRDNLSAYDAWYAALAEALACPLVTLDRRLARTPGLACPVLVPPR